MENKMTPPDKITIKELLDLCISTSIYAYECNENGWNNIARKKEEEANMCKELILKKVRDLETKNKKEDMIKMEGETIKLQYKQIEASKVVIGKLLAFSLPVEASYWVGRNIKSLAQATKPLEEERKRLITTHGVRDPNTNLYSISPDNEDFKKFIEQEVEVTIHKIELKNLFPARLTINEVEQINFMIVTDKLVKLAKTFNEIK